jgi:YidC/Oxa1 family membrane protein insertase
MKFREWLAVPFGIVIAAFYSITDNYLLSLLLLVIIVKLILLPSQISMQKNQAKQLRLKPKADRIREKYAGNQQKINQELQNLYSQEGYGSASAGCVPMLIQLPIMMGVYFAANYSPLTNILRIPKDVVANLKEAAAPYVQQATEVASKKASSGAAAYQGEIDVIKYLDKIDLTAVKGVTTQIADKITHFASNFKLFGIDLTVTPNYKHPDKFWIIPAILLVITLIQSFYMLARQKKTNPEMAKNPTTGCMTFMSPAMMVWFAFILPTNVSVYMILSSLISLIQMFILNYTHSPNKVLSRLMVDETIYRRSKEASMKKALEAAQKD